MTAVLSVVLLAATVVQMARIHMLGLPGQPPKGLPKLKRGPEPSDAS